MKITAPVQIKPSHLSAFLMEVHMSYGMAQHFIALYLEMRLYYLVAKSMLQSGVMMEQ